jgi:tRNA-2-methylthio-N6-dimethylallyladenosine synthase
MTHKTFYIETYGCQMNIYDSCVVADILICKGFRHTGVAEDADLVLVNTCSVRDRAERKALSRLTELAALKRSNPHLIIGVIGCMAQRLGEKLIDRGVDLVLGPDCYSSLGDLLDRLAGSEAPVVETSQNNRSMYSLMPEHRDSVKAFTTIMRGCNNLCSYCVVPYVRGRERSKPHREIIAEIEHIVGLGSREVTLIGQNVNSYDDGSTDFTDLLRLVNDIDGLERIRFTTSHPKDLSHRLMDQMRDLSKVCEHLHLPLQSGSDRILSLMNRDYTYRRYRELVETARSKVGNLAVTTDIMVGFPTESLTDFRETVRAMEEIRFDAAFMFRYSPRDGTHAYRMKDDVPVIEKIARLKEVIGLQNRLTDEKKQQLMDQEVEVLIEGESTREPGFAIGRTRKNWLAKVPLKGVSKGEIVIARVTGATRWMLACEVIPRKVGT